MTATTNPDTNTEDARVAAVVEAHRTREAEFAEIEQARSAARRAANARFVLAVRESDVSMTAIARACGISRQVLHDLVKNHGSATT